MDLTNGLIPLEIWHGGKFKGDEYVLGKLQDIDIPLDILTLSELEKIVKSKGYHSGVKYAVRDMNEQKKFIFFHDEQTLRDILMSRIDIQIMSLELFVEALTADLTEVVDDMLVNENDIDRETSDWLSGVLSDEYESDKEISDFMEDEDFSSDDEEFVELRKHVKNAKESRTEDECFNFLQPQTTTLLSISDAEHVEYRCESEYEASDASLDSSEDADFIIRKTTRKSNVYAKNCDHKSLIFHVGMKFNNCKECQEAVRLWAILNGHNIKWKKSGKIKLEAICVPGCPWKFYASKLQGEPTCVIKTYVGEHKCVRAVRNKQANSEWVANVILPTMRRNPVYGLNDIMNDVQLAYDITINEDLAYRARTKAREKLRGTFDSHYKKLRSYVKGLKEKDKAGRFELMTYLDHKDRPVFKRIYIGFSALKNGFMVGCRKAIGFDACFLKTVLGGALLAGVAKDCNNKMYPVAWAVVEKENEETWTWFFEILFEELNIQDGFGWTFMSDKQKGLINGIKKLAPNVEHRHCARHVYANWKKTYSGPKYKALFWEAVKNTSETRFKLKMNELKAESVLAYEDFWAKQPQSFCKSLVSLQTKTDVVDNNICETFNSYILKFRDKPLIDMLEDIRLHLMTRMHDIFKSINASADILCPNIRKKLERIQFFVKFCKLRPAVGGKYEVHMGDDSYIVDLVSRECSCRWWLLTGIPCCHALACIFYSRDDLVRYVDVFYYKSNCIETYKHALTPFDGPSEWPEVNEPPILPPEYVRLPGRPKKKRTRDPTEDLEAGLKRLPKKIVKMSCHKCGQFGHNVRTCKEEGPSIQVKPKGKRGRPKKVVETMQRQTSESRERQASQIRERRLTNQGYGTRYFAESGNIYHKAPGARRVNLVHAGRTRENTSRVQVQENSQRSHVDDGCTPPPAS